MDRLAPPAPTPKSRKIGLNHFAFFRAYLQGMDAKQMWTRYMDVYGPADIRTIRLTLHWLRQEFMTAARRADRPRVAALLKRDPNLMPEGKTPALDDFAQRYPEGFYTQTELQELFDAEFGKSGPGRRRMRLRERQLEALYWVEQHVVSHPHLDDRVDGWLEQVLAKRLLAAGIVTLADLVSFINSHGYRWWTHIERLGEQGAARILRWLSENTSTMGVTLGPQATTPRRALAVNEIADTLPKTTAIVPMERLLVPATLDGSSGRFRADQELCMLDASDDYAAIEAWLRTKRDSNTTRRSCRKEAERFLLWAVVQKGKPLSSMSSEDCTEYRDFLADPQPRERWCGPRCGERWGTNWRPFAGPLSPRSQHQALVILKSLFEWLMRARYLIGNAWDGVPPLALPPPQKITGRSLSRRQWAELLVFCETLPNTGATRRIHFLLNFAYATGLRLSELAKARTGHLHRVAVDDEAGEAWVLEVVGKRQKQREVPMPDLLMAALSDYLVYRGLSGDPRECAKDTPLIGKLDQRTGTSSGDASDALTPGAIYKMLDTVFKSAAETLENPEDAARLRQASTHWLRHTHGTHAVADKVPLDVVQYILGHASLDTTSIYVTAERSRRIKEMRRFTQGRGVN